jgi:nitrogen fixation-related uncharacterized protein
MRLKLKLMRILVGVGGFLLVMAPGTALAHDNLGGDELATANWMLVGAMVTIVIGLLWGLWAINSGQFSNIEESKFTMLDNSEDFDVVMAEADDRERAAKAARSAEQPNPRPAAPVEPAVPSAKQERAHI